MWKVGWFFEDTFRSPKGELIDYFWSRGTDERPTVFSDTIQLREKTLFGQSVPPSLLLMFSALKTRFPSLKLPFRHYETYS